MWEVLAVLFGGLYVVGKISTDKEKAKIADAEAKKRIDTLSRFRDQFTNRNAEKEVWEMIDNEECHTAITKEISELFDKIPELQGMEHLWNVRDGAVKGNNNLHLTSLILCVNRGFLPMMDTYNFTLWKAIVSGDTKYGIPCSISLSDDSMEIIAKYISDKLGSYNSGCYLKYLPSTVAGSNFVWKVK